LVFLGVVGCVGGGDAVLYNLAEIRRDIKRMLGSFVVAGYVCF
jgi:hypothetical protein